MTNALAYYNVGPITAVKNFMGPVFAGDEVSEWRRGKKGLKWRDDIQHNDIQHNDIQHNDTQPKDTQQSGLFGPLNINDIKHNWHSA